VFLKALTLKGFKSFADTTTMALEPGVTVVVGPNGSGKSNVVDAIAWVLGAQAPSAVRSQKMDDVIFAGTVKKAALGRAEVSLTLDNSAGLLPIEFTEVTITRILFRTGESEYMINGVGCRLLDVQELLSDAGVGRQQHVIVSQGQIDAVLNARPEDRRSIIEEAAGVLKFRKRKERAERRLDATEASLLRVQDLLREVRRQLRPLERQAEAAARHGALVAELTALRLYLAGREIEGFTTRLDALAGQRRAAEEAEAELREKLAALDAEVLAAEAELTARGDSDIGDELMRVEQLRERARGLSAVLAERRRSMERDRGALMDAGVVANLEAEAARVRDELEAVARDLAQLEPAAAELEADESAFADARTASQQDTTTVAPSSKAASAAAEVRGELRSLRGAVERSNAERSRVTGRLTNLASRATQLESTAERLRTECAEAEAIEAPLVEEASAAETRRADAEEGAAAAALALAGTSAEVARWHARAEALQLALDSARAKAGAEKLAGVDGVVGSLVDLVQIDSGWEPAVEAALGEALQAVIVANPVAAREALQHLRDGATTGAVLALGAAHAVAVDHGVTVGEPVRPHIRAADRGVADLLDVLLLGAVRVGSWEAALDASIAAPGAVVVTAEGDRFATGGWRLGAAGGGATAAALDEANERMDVAQLAHAAAVEADRVAKAEAKAAIAADSDVQRRLDANDRRFTAAAEALARAQTDRQSVESEVAEATQVQAAIDERIARDAQRVQELEDLLPALEADEAAEAEAARDRTRAQAELNAQAALLAGRRRDLEVRNADLHGRQQLLERRLVETEQRLEADVAARAAAETRRERIERDLGAVARLGELVERHRAVIETRHGELQEIRRRQSDEVRGLAQRLDVARRARTDTDRQLEEVRERAHRGELEVVQLQERLEATVETLRRDQEVEPEVALAAPAPELPLGVNAASRAHALDEELRKMGPINPLALEEFNELQERHTFLEAQLDDVRATRRELSQVIHAVDAEIQSVFAAAFADVSENFTQLFNGLFPGGSGRLVLTNPDDLLNTGIEVEAKPSGKNVKKLSLLSGGERSLTALAYLFAVFRSRPSPFYVMDEVEAALDDVNLHRFLGLINEFRKDAQLLIVSHQKRTMDAGDCLLGVSMQPGGSSKVITERVTSTSAR
jgi:chromosome segregation protein